MKVGLVGLPNSGKSTLFNTVTGMHVPVAPFPYTTTETTVGAAHVPDERLTMLGRLAASKKVVPTTVEMVDIAGLAPGASTGEGIGNQFLGSLREVDALCHVVRCFDSDDVPHVHGEVDPVADVELVDTELVLKDLDTVERRVERAVRAARSGDKGLQEEAAFLETLRAHLGDGQPARLAPGLTERVELARDLSLLTAKPVLYAANVAEADLPDGGERGAIVRTLAAERGAEAVVVSAEVEAQLSELDDAERAEYLESLGLERSGLERLVAAAYGLLGLITFLTAGPKESRAWTVRAGTPAPRAAREIHSDIERGFIRVEVITYDDWAKHGSEAAAKEAGAMRVEGKDYVIKDGDVVHFRFNV